MFSLSFAAFTAAAFSRRSMAFCSAASARSDLDVDVAGERGAEVTDEDEDEDDGDGAPGNKDF